MEIYNEQLFDLLAALPEAYKSGLDQLAIADDAHGVYVRGLQSHVAYNEEEALNMLFEVRIFVLHAAQCDKRHTEAMSSGYHGL